MDEDSDIESASSIGKSIPMPLATLLFMLYAIYTGDDDYDGNDMSFDGAFVEKPQMKAYDVEFSVQSTNNLMKMQEKEVEQVSTILGKYR